MNFVDRKLFGGFMHTTPTPASSNTLEGITFKNKKQKVDYIKRMLLHSLLNKHEQLHALVKTLRQCTA